MSLIEVKSDVLHCYEADMIVQQCNCITVRAHGLSDAIARRFSYGNLYASRTSQSSHGNIATDKTRGRPGMLAILAPPPTPASLDRLVSTTKRRRLNSDRISPPEAKIESTTEAKTEAQVEVKTTLHLAAGPIEKPESDGKEWKPLIACLFGQWAPGKPSSWCAKNIASPFGEDSYVNRTKWFQQALHHLSELLKRDAYSSIRTIAFPTKIGCGLAGGDWRIYLRLLKEFARCLPSHRILLAAPPS